MIVEGKRRANKGVCQGQRGVNEWGSLLISITRSVVADDMGGTREVRAFDADELRFGCREP